MLPVLGAAVAMLLFEAAAILMSTGLCARHPKLKRRDGKRYGADVGYGSRGGNGADVIFASGLGDGVGGGYQDDWGGTDAGAGSDRGGDGGDRGGGDGGGGGCGGGGCGGGCGGGGGGD